ncbi:MAG: DUF4392 domain-containing protein [Ardenticatenaceae bacterium]|nr:DUF4392 domain-containing protein [Ardenticatenaceae bacterium]
MATDTQLMALGESVDRFLSIDITGRGIVRQLYAAAREKQEGPLSFLAARALLNRVGPRDVVLISTGMPVGPWQMGEQDGPVGAATLARSLVLGLGAKPLILTEAKLVETVTATVRAAGLHVFPLEQALQYPTATAVLPFPLDVDEAPRVATELLDRLHPQALVAIERAGANEYGVYHRALGASLTAHTSKQDVLFEQARARGILTIAIGDGGNELGCGLIKETVLEVVPIAARCRCPCGGTVVPVFIPDILIVSAISNWGVYGIEACLSAALARREILHDRDVDLRVHVACAAAGGDNDGPRLLDPGSDAVPAPIHGHILEILALMAENSTEPGGLYRSARWPWLDR